MSKKLKNKRLNFGNKGSHGSITIDKIRTPQNDISDLMIPSNKEDRKEQEFDCYKNLNQFLTGFVNPNRLRSTKNITPKTEVQKVDMSTGSVDSEDEYRVINQRYTNYDTSEVKPYVYQDSNPMFINQNSSSPKNVY